MYLAIGFVLVACATFVHCKCPNAPSKPFNWRRCDDNFKGPITVLDCQASQHGKSVDSNGGLSLKEKLTLTFKLKNDYENQIGQHLVDYTVYQYDFDGCKWNKLDIDGALDGQDACQFIHDNCNYKGRPSRVVSVTDFPALMSDFGGTDLLEAGGYYAFEIVDRDGNNHGKNKKLNCFRLEAKLLNF